MYILSSFTQPSGDCNTFPQDWGISLEGTITSGTEQDVGLNCAAGTLRLGDESVTCYAGSHFIYSKTPQCLETGTSIDIHNLLD